MVRVAIKESSFCIIEFSLSPISKFIHSPNYVATTSFQALVLTIGGDSVFHFNPLRSTVCDLWNRCCGASVLRADKTRTSRIRFSIAVLSIPCYFTDGRCYPQNVRRTAVLSCDSKVHPTSSFLISPHLNFRAANRVVCWLYLINREIIAQILQLFIVVLCPRPKLCTGVSTVEFMYLWIDRFHCPFLVLCIYTATTGHLLYLSQYTLFLVRQVPNLHTIVVARLNHSLVQACWSSRNHNCLIAFASLTFRVVIRCAMQEMYYWRVMATISSACLVHLLFLRHLV